MKGLVSIWLALQSIFDGIKGSIRHHSKSLQHWNVGLKWARRPTQPNPTKWGNSARDSVHCTLIFHWTLVWSLPGRQMLSSRGQRGQALSPSSPADTPGEWTLSPWGWCIRPASYSQWSDSDHRPQGSVPGQSCRSEGWAWWKDELDLAWETTNRDQNIPKLKGGYLDARTHLCSNHDKWDSLSSNPAHQASWKEHVLGHLVVFETPTRTPPPARRQHILSCFCIEGTGKVWATSAKHLASWAKWKPSLLHWVSANIKYDVKHLRISFSSLGTL